MNNFKVGDYVVHQALVDYRCFDVPCSTPIDIYKIEKVDGCSIWVCGICKDYDLFRQATVLDYIRTSNVKQMARILQIAKKKCRFCVERRADTGDCKYYTHLQEECDDGIVSFLNQPLTDKIVEWLGEKK